MSATRIPALGALWLGLAAAYLAASALDHLAAALAVLGLMAGALVAASGHRLIGFITGGAAAAAAWHFSESVAVLVYIPPLAAFAFMAYFFARTLREGSEPLVSRIARKANPLVPPEVALYTRALTGLWAACFVALFLTALALAQWLPLDAWSRWVQGLGLVVPAALFAGEHAWRRHRFPERARGSITGLVPTVVAVFRESSGERR